MKKLSLVILSVLVLSAAASAQKALFLVAGQSNGVGQGDASLSVKTPRRLYMNMYLQATPFVCWQTP